MTRNLKALGLALVAVCAMSAVAASAASAEDDHFLAEQETALLTGTSGDHAFKITGTAAEFGCETASFAGTFVNNATTVTVDPTYTGRGDDVTHNTEHLCDSTLGDVKYDTNGCHYVLTGSTTNEDPGLDAEFWIQCPEGKVIQTTSPELGVTISIPSQTPTEGGVSYKNLPNHPGGAAIELITTATGITTTCAPTFICTLGGIPHHANTTDYNGTMVLTGYEDTDGLPTPIEEGGRIGIAVQTT